MAFVFFEKSPFLKSPRRSGDWLFDFGRMRAVAARRRVSFVGTSSPSAAPHPSPARDQITMLMILPGTTITFLGVFPSTHFCASGAFTMSA